jgi:protein-S-isoprenylcysteine O-methyltransferase Ste14
MNLVLLLVGVVFPISEITLAIVKRARTDEANVQDRGTMLLLWLVIIVSVVLAIMCVWVKATRFQITEWLYYTLTIGLMILGLIIRWSAIITLGRMFTTNVAIQDNHQLVEKGLYRYIRHPSYSGLLLEFLALGFYTANWLSMITLLGPITTAVMIRILREEKVLSLAFGASYCEYSSRTKRLIPWLW